MNYLVAFSFRYGFSDGVPMLLAMFFLCFSNDVFRSQNNVGETLESKSRKNVVPDLETSWTSSDNFPAVLWKEMQQNPTPWHTVERYELMLWIIFGGRQLRAHNGSCFYYNEIGQWEH